MTSDADGQDLSKFPGQPAEEQVDMICDKFEEVWRSGGTARAEDFIPATIGTDRRTLLRELLALEIDYRRRRGEPLNDAELMTRLPDETGLFKELISSEAPVAGLAAPLETLGQYRLLTQIGKGGMGTVYKAMHTRLEKTVAIKVLAANHTQDSQILARFEREMKAVGRLQHPNIVGAHDAGESEGVHFLVMEYVDGVDLSRLLARHGPLSVADACEIGRQTALALQEACDHGMVHRDVKPSNLMLTVQRRQGKSLGLIKLLDLGLATLSDAALRSHVLTQTGQLMGTVDYMSPEQVQDVRGVDIRSDLYSLGATLYKLLTDSAPFAHEEYDTLQKRLRAVVKTPATPISSLRPDLPVEVASLIDRLLAKSPADRPATADQVAELLARYAGGISSELIDAIAQSGTLRRNAGSTHRTPPVDPGAVTIKSNPVREPEPEKSANEPQAAVFSASGNRRRALVALAFCALVVVCVVLYLTVY